MNGKPGASKGAGVSGASKGAPGASKRGAPAASGSRSSAGAAPKATGAKGAKVSLPRTGSRAASGPYKVSLALRAGAGAIDGLIALLPGIAVYFAVPIAAVLLPIAYVLLRDGLPVEALEYQSIGKKIVGLHVEVAESGENRLDPVRSLKRNAPLVVGLVLFPLISLISLPAAVGLALLPGVVEVIMAATDPNGLRLGDRIAGTRVLD